jgi:hypothetical protein
VVLGLLIEVWLAIEFRPVGESFTQTWGPVFADALIALGVFFEILFGSWALHQASELQQRAERALAEATERAGNAISRAAAAELQTERLRKELAWRRISTDEVKKISEFLTTTPKLCLRVTHPANDPEAVRLAHDFGDVFRANGWRVLFIATVSSQGFSGMMIPLWGGPT